MTTTVIRITALVVACHALAQAQTGMPAADRIDRFTQFDKNSDGKVTPDEADNAAWFDTLDANHDGAITRLEAAGAAWSAGESTQAKGAWYLVRHADGRYGTGQAFDPEVIPTAPGGLRCVRNICASPFPGDCGRVFYFGGYDGGDLGTGMKHRDTAWIYRGMLLTAGKEKR